MPTDILSLPLGSLTGADPNHACVTLRPLESATIAELASIYLESYPPGVAVSDLEEATEEMEASFRGDFGTLRSDASASAWHDDHPVGAIMVVEHSIWDEGLEGPFIIDLFVSPMSRGLGAGRALVSHAVASCTRAGNSTLSLRFGDGTSPAAMAIYRDLGFGPLTDQ